MPLPRVSVIIPNYNHAAFLPQRIESVLNQTFRDFEVILLDDCSPDESRAIMEKYRVHPQVSQIIYNEKNSGSTFLQWKKGFGFAAGEYIWIAESDDYCEPNFLERLVSALDTYPLAGVAYCQSFRVNENGKEINDFRQWKDKDWPSIFYLEGKEMALDHFLNGRAIPNASTALFKKSMIPTSNFYTTFRYSGDIIFWLSILKKSGIVVVNQRLNYFRKHEKNVSGKVSKNGLDIIESMRVFEYMDTLFDLPKGSKKQKSIALAQIFVQNQLLSQKRVSISVFIKIIKESVSFDKSFVWKILKAGMSKIFKKIHV